MLISNKHLFLTFVEAGKPKIKVLEDSLLGEDVLPSSLTVVSLSSQAGSVRELSLGLFIRALISFIGAPLS